MGIGHNIVAFFSKIIAKIGIRYKRELTIDEIDFINNFNVSGCIILSRTKNQLSNWFITGHFKHSMIFATKFWIVDSTVRFGVSKRGIECLRGYSEYKIFRPKFELDKEDLKNICFDFVSQDIPYDHYHTDGNPFYDCTELVRKVFISLMVPIDYKWPFYPQRLIETGLFEEIYHFKEKR